VRARKRVGLVRARRAVGLTQEEAAYRLDVDRTTIGRWESGESEPLPWIRPKLANLLGVTLARLEQLLLEVDTQTDPSAAEGGDRRDLDEHRHAVPANPEDQERVALAARHPRRVDAATVGALADVLAATRRVEDRIGSAAVLPGVGTNLALVHSLLADARHPIRDQVGSLAGELHQYQGWLLTQTGCPEQAQAELDAALALGVEFDDPDLASHALFLKSHLAWILDDPQGVIALSRAASRDPRVFVAQHAENAYYEARGWAMLGELTEVHRDLRRADEFAERAVARQAEAPPSLYWCGSGYFTLERGSAWHTLKDARFAERAATEIINGLREMPEAERDSEWATIYHVRAAEAFTTAGQAERAVAHARQALVVCRATCSTRLARALQRAQTQMRNTWPTHAPIRELADDVRLLTGAR